MADGEALSRKSGFRLSPSAAHTFDSALVASTPEVDFYDIFIQEKLEEIGVCTEAASPAIHHCSVLVLAAAVVVDAVNRCPR